MIAVAAAAVLALVFDFTNGFHDSANAVAALVATRAATPRQAVVLAAVAHVAGPLLVGTAVAATIGETVVIEGDRTVMVVGAALSGAIVWNLVTWWRGMPSSSSHALVGGLVGAALVTSGPAGVQWGGVAGGRPHGIVGVLVALAISPVLGFVAGLAANISVRRVLRRAHRRIERVVLRGEWVTAAALAFSHGANDAQKTMGVITLLLVASGHLATFTVPLWVKLAAAASLTIGTALGGWRIVRTLGSGVYRIRPVDGLAAQGSSAAVIFAAAAIGGPVSTTHVVASAVVGVGAARRARRVRWAVVREMAAAWVVTLPAAALLAAAAVPLWRW